MEPSSSSVSTQPGDPDGNGPAVAGPAIALAPSQAPTRSLVACLPCRKAKVKCSGETVPCRRCSSSDIECIFVAPRPARVVGSEASHSDSITVPVVDPHMSRRLPVPSSSESSGSLARLWQEFESLRRTHNALIDSQGALLEQHARTLARLDGSALRHGDGEPPAKRRMVHTGTAECASRQGSSSKSSKRPDHANDLVQLGLVLEEQVEDLYGAYTSRCSTRISVLLPAPPLAILRQSSPHLFSVVLTLGLRTMPALSDLHHRCYKETVRRLRAATPATREERYDMIHACLHVCMWYGDTKLGRLGLVEAYEEKMYASWAEAQASRRAREARGSVEENGAEAATSRRFKLWLMCCAVEQLSTRYQYRGGPSLISAPDLLASIEEAQVRLLSGVEVSGWDYQICANLELFDIAGQSNEIFSPLRNPDLQFDATAVACISKLNAMLDGWATRWEAFAEPTPGEDRNRLIIPGCAVRAGINAFALQDVDSAPPSSLLHPARITCLNTAVDAAVMLLSTALSSATYSVTLSYSIDFAFNHSLSFAGGFLLTACKAVPHLLDLPRVLAVLRDTASLLETHAGQRGQAFNTQFSAMRDTLAAIGLAPPSPSSFATFPDPSAASTGAVVVPPNGGDILNLTDVFGQPEDQWQSLLEAMMRPIPAEWSTPPDQALFG